MNFTRLDYDNCTYEHNLKQSVGVGDYIINTPTIECNGCYIRDPTQRLGKFVGGSVASDKPLVDVSSELLNITRKASNCPTQKYIPGADPFCNLKHLPVCDSYTAEDTRISNPPCTLRSTGWNRWEWLCKNPQDKALIPFDYNINYRMIVKDNHRPCLPHPIDFTQTLPPDHFNDTEITGVVPCSEVSNEIPSTHWRKACEYERYGV